MIHFDLPKEKSSILKVIGIGGGGSNAVNYMHSQGIENVNFIICNTDAQAISHSKVPNKVQLGPHLTQGLGAGANPEIGRQATEESLEEIRRILEVNTKMAFITAGMGGGTGTGGAPIIAQVCKEMGILTVGIVTTPFSYEGKKRIMQGEEGINKLKDYVDTLLVISNDKLRHQYGNLKMKEAFAKADNVLATAAKCITDVINSTGQINVDFADVCTVMKNGGVAILGSGAAEGEGRAQRAIEQALNSPLLNDNDIQGAKWILININSCEGEHEFTMDEVDIIQSHLLGQAGPNTDVIMGLGYDNALGSQIGITLIATGFEHKDPFRIDKPKTAQVPVKEEKIVMTLGMEGEEKKIYNQPALFQEIETPLPLGAEVDAAMPPHSGMDAPVFVMPEEPVVSDSMTPSLVEPTVVSGDHSFFIGRVDKAKGAVEAKEPKIVMSLEDNDALVSAMPAAVTPSPAQAAETPAQSSNPSDQSGHSRSFLARPSNVYEEAGDEALPTAGRQVPIIPEETAPFDMQLVIKDEPARPEAQVNPPAEPRPEPRLELRPDGRPEPRPDGRPEPRPDGRPEPRPETRFELRPDSRPEPRPDLRPEARPEKAMPSAQDPAGTAGEEADEQRRKAAERLQKLRNLSFNVNAQDAGTEFEAIPAYMRRNMELYNTVNSIENFYSNYSVKSSDDNKGEITTINTFLDGKKPD